MTERLFVRHPVDPKLPAVVELCGTRVAAMQELCARRIDYLHGFLEPALLADRLREITPEDLDAFIAREG